MIRKGERVYIRPEWQDTGDKAYIWIAVNDEEKGRVDIMPLGCALALTPLFTVLCDMLDTTTPRGN